ncbi:MAG: helix-turn-helix transcriptional regulator [Bdellovibrionaceae bacterium]|nr:helix-turn-helix transcriptional regulator [Pseudobdellovibrionaceae bacterium]
MKKPKRATITPFAKILKALMKERGLTMREVAKIAGVSPSTVNDWQSGSTPENYLAVKKLAKELGVSFSFLLTGEEEAVSKNQLPSITEVFDDGGALFDGYAKITIQRLVPRKKD